MTGPSNTLYLVFSKFNFPARRVYSEIMLLFWGEQVLPESFNDQVDTAIFCFLLQYGISWCLVWHLIFYVEVAELD